MITLSPEVEPVRAAPTRKTRLAREGRVERRTDVMSRRRLAWSIWAGTGTIIVTAAAGLIVYEFGHGILPGVLTL